MNNFPYRVLQDAETAHLAMLETEKLVFLMLYARISHVLIVVSAMNTPNVSSIQIYRQLVNVDQAIPAMVLAKMDAFT